MPVQTYSVAARRIDQHGSLAACKDAEIALDTGLAGRRDAFNPAELFLAAVAACMLTGIERDTPMLDFKLDGVRVELTAVREEKPPRIAEVAYTLIVDSPESDRRLELLHENVRKFGTIYNTVAGGTSLRGSIRRGV